MSKLVYKLVLLLAIGVGCPCTTSAEGLTGGEMRSLDGEVQEIKSDVLGIASELRELEERLLYPSNTQVSLFVSVPKGESFRLDAVHVRIDGELTADHIYSFNELEALQKGGVQRLFTGNVTTGDHAIGVTVLGKLKNGEDFSAADDFHFSKGVAPEAVGITLRSPSSGESGISIREW